MRKLVVALAAALAAGALGCGGGSTPDNSANASPSSTPSPTAPPPPTFIDFVPKPYNGTGFPTCGFYTTTMDVGGGKVMLLNLGVAVQPYSAVFDPNPRPVPVHFEYAEAVPGHPGGWSTTAEFDQTGKITTGSSVTLSDASFAYVTLMENVIMYAWDPISKKWRFYKPGWEEWFGKAHTVTATVNKHTLTMQVKPTKRLDIGIKDNTCTVAS